MMVYEKKNRPLVFSVDRNNPNPRVHRSSGKLASFPTVTVEPMVGIFLSPLNTNNGSILVLKGHLKLSLHVGS